MRNIRVIQYSSRNKKLRVLGFESYREYLKSDLWKKVREKILKEKSWKGCSVCKIKEIKLIPHHLRYKRVNKDSTAGIVLVCESCHYKIHTIHNVKANLSIFQITRNLKRKLNYWQKFVEKYGVV